MKNYKMCEEWALSTDEICDGHRNKGSIISYVFFSFADCEAAESQPNLFPEICSHMISLAQSSIVMLML